MVGDAARFPRNAELADRAFAATIDTVEPDGRHLLIADPDGDHHIWIQGDHGQSPLSVLIPLGDQFQLRNHAAARFDRVLSGKRSGPLPPPYRLTAQQRGRLVLALRAFDARDAGASQRDIAQLLFRANTQGRAWTGSSDHLRTKRILRLGTRLVGGGYLQLLDPYRTP